MVSIHTETRPRQPVYTLQLELELHQLPKQTRTTHPEPAMVMMPTTFSGLLLIFVLKTVFALSSCEAQRERP